MQVKTEHIGLAVFMTAVVATAALVWFSVSGQQWPEWLLLITTVL